MRNRFFLSAILWLIGFSAYAVTIEGTVYDENKETIIGAGIVLKGDSGTGTVTDADGHFSLDVPDVKNGVIVVSAIGYKTKYIPLNGRTVLVVELEPEFTELDEVIVVGYGTMKKSDLTGSVATVKTSEAEAARATSLDKLLQGKAAGVSVTTGDAAPGGAVSVQIRGASSLRGDNTPLYVVDGVIMDMDETGDPMGAGDGAGNSRLTPQNPLSSISPQDIASIEILKDASATAIYGSKGANGVVLITTKRGTSSKPAVTFSANATVSAMVKKIDVLDYAGYVQFYNNSPENGLKYGPLDESALSPVNWQDEATRIAFSQNYRASVSGKSNRTSYYVAAGYMKNRGVIKKTDISKYDFRVNLDQGIGEYVKLSTSTLFSSLNTNMTSGTDKLANISSSIVRHMTSYRPYRSGDATDLIDYDEDLTTPDAWFTDYDDDSRERLLITNLNLDVKPLKWFTIRLKAGVNYKNKERLMWYGTGLSAGSKVNGKAGKAAMSSISYNAEALLMFKKTFRKKHSLNATAGVVYNSKDVDQDRITGENFANKSLRAKGISLANILYPYQYTEVGEQLFSVLARALYSYDNRYSLTATFRADGSSKFAKGNKFSYFPSFAAAWRINNESFLRDVKEISNLKLRLGWGQVGNQAISSYQILKSYASVNYAKPESGSEVGVVSSRIPNPDLKWETTSQYNVGLDFGMFDQRLTMTMDLYHKTTEDLLHEISIGTHAGYEKMWINNGSVLNQGLELSLQGIPVSTKDWSWTIGGNISFNRNRILSLGMSPADFGVLKNQSGYLGAKFGNGSTTKFPANIFLVGQSIGLFYGYQTDGIMQQEQFDSSENQAKQLTINNKPIQPGDVLYVDQNGDRKIDDKDMTIIGNPNPKFIYALTTSLSWKNLTLDLTFNGVYGNQILNANLIELTDVKNARKNILSDAYYKAWTPENRSNSYPRLGYQPTGVFCDRYIEDGSYLRLADVSLSYLLMFKKTKAIKSISFTLSAGNVFTITDYSGYDPDVNTFSNDVDRLGVEQTAYPSARNFSLGIIATF